jgi:hypothetical protein
VDYRLKTYAAEVAKRCAFLVSEHGFAEPSVQRGERGMPTVSVRYTRDDVVVHAAFVMWYMGEEYVTMWLERPDGAGERQRHMLGDHVAHKGHAMRKGIDRQAAALRELLGTLGISKQTR